ncbi:transmembrane family 220 protein [Tepidamorphus gemmatus]|uniref:Transmembrane family 220 protein n=1 Tax=Tepidamorphus gemmatus TaxID=747076 RepID=A0A4R3MG61_9HYPH|nr:transmembrane 220 family protein [Tepidamorphus gemmatus]TCT12591.1 transmembrane family 220 protein [Tepidamorphus gemmatus]
MRVLHGALCLMLLLFAALQYNDPDPEIWIPIYAIPGILAGIAAGRPHAVQHGALRSVVLAVTVLALLGVYHYWPQTQHFWKIDVWWQDEAAREGLGAMIVAVTMLAVAIPALLRR